MHAPNLNYALGYGHPALKWEMRQSHKDAQLCCPSRFVPGKLEQTVNLWQLAGAVPDSLQPARGPGKNTKQPCRTPREKLGAQEQASSVPERADSLLRRQPLPLGLCPVHPSAQTLPLSLLTTACLLSKLFVRRRGAGNDASDSQHAPRMGEKPQCSFYVSDSQA